MPNPQELNPKHHPKLAGLKGALPFDVYDDPVDRNASLFLDKERYFNGEFTNAAQVQAIYLEALQYAMLNASFLNIKKTDFGYLISENGRTVVYAHCDGLYTHAEADLTTHLSNKLQEIQHHCEENKITPNEIRYTQIIHVNGNHWINLGILFSNPLFTENDYQYKYQTIEMTEMDSLKEPTGRSSWANYIYPMFCRPHQSIISKSVCSQQISNTCGFHAGANAASFGIYGSPMMTYAPGIQRAIFTDIMNNINRHMLSKRSNKDFKSFTEFNSQFEEVTASIRSLSSSEKTEYQKYISNCLAWIASLAEKDASIKPHDAVVKAMYDEKITKISHPDYRAFLKNLKEICDTNNLGISIETNQLIVGTGRASVRHVPDIKETKSTIVPKKMNYWNFIYLQINPSVGIDYFFNDEKSAQEMEKLFPQWVSSSVFLDQRLKKYVFRRWFYTYQNDEHNKLLTINSLRKQNKFSEIANLIREMPEQLFLHAVLLQSEEDESYNILTKALWYGENPPTLIKTIIEKCSPDNLYAICYRALKLSTDQINILIWIVWRAAEAEYSAYISIASEIIQKLPGDKLQQLISTQAKLDQDSDFHRLITGVRLDHFEQLIDKLPIKFLEAALLAPDREGFTGFALCVYSKPQLMQKIISKISQKTLDQILITKSQGVNGLLLSVKMNPNDFIMLIEKASAEAIHLCLTYLNKKNQTGLQLAIATLDKKTLLALLRKTNKSLIEAAVAKKVSIVRMTSKAEENMAVLETFLNPEEKKPVAIKPKETKQANLPVSNQITEEKGVNPEIQNLIAAHHLEPLLTRIHSQYKMDSKVSPANKPIETWEIEDCKAWANKIKNRLRSASPEDLESLYYPEIMAVLMRATQLYAGYLPRDVQIASLLLFLKKPDKRRLAQIATGEGKSLIVAMLAVMKSLQGEVVDIVTSSPVLAARDAEEMRGFYSIFDLTVADNWDEKEGGKYKGGYKSCYSADIVYGDACSFQWDTLRQEYLKDGTRGNRPYQTVIVDEADSMLIDQFADSGELVVTKPAMEYLNLLLVAAWQELARIEQHLGGITTENTPTAKKILKNFLTELITGPSSQIYIPGHLKELAIDHIESWIESAFVARYQYVNGRDYIIIKGKEKNDDDIIACLDYSNTGVLHSNMVWNNGLHQFLQIKHQLKVFPESIFSPEISNMAYFNRYTNGLYGMSGTLGSKVTQEVLQEAYAVDFVFVPTFKTKRFSEIPPVVSENDDAWLSAVIESVTRESAAGKPVLLICESINDVERIEAKLAEFYRTSKPAHVKRYSRSDTTENLVVSNKIESGQIIIATNLAGRGTDIKPEDKVEASGGLHVCLTYLPDNQRVEDQALGRTARQGKSGTGQLIINKKRELTKLSKYFRHIPNTTNIQQLKKLRDQAEIIDLNNIKNFGIKKVTLQDKLFSKFCTLRKDLLALNDNKYLFSEIEDRYGLWLKKRMDRIEREKKIESDVILAEFETFRQDCLRIYKESGLKNPAQLILDANSTEDYAKAIQAYSKAIELDPVVATQAFFNRAFARLATKGENAKELAQKDLAVAKTQLQEQLIPQLQTMHILRQLSPEQLSGFSDLEKQIQAKIQFYEYQIQHIDNTIKFLKEAKAPHFKVRENFGRFADLCNDLHMSGRQIQELYDSGMKGFYELEAIPEQNDSLWGLLGVAFLGVMQIVAGVAITLVQPAIGAALISEGVGDIMFAIRGALEGRFSWDAYQATKTTSMAITIITLGINAIRNGMPTAQPALSPATITRNQFVQLAGEQIVKAGISSAIKQTVSFGLDHLTKGAINHFKSDIEEAVKKVILENFNIREIQIALDKLFAADLRNGNLANATNLKQLITEVLYSLQSKEGISLTILKGVLANQHSGLGKLLKLADMSNAIANIVSFTQSFCHDFNNGVKLYSAPLPAPDGDFSRYRADLCNQIASSISNCIINYLHKGVAVPATNLAAGKFVDNLADNIQRVCNPFIAVEETKTPANFEENDSSGSPEEDEETLKKSKPLVKKVVDIHETKHVDIREISGNDQLKSPDGIPLFRNKREDLKGTHIRYLTVDELKRFRVGTTILYVITPDKKLHLAERFENGKMIFHSDLARDQPVFAAGEINIKKNLFTINSYYIDDCSGHYQPEGEHLKKLVLEKFAEYGLSGSRVFFANQCGVGNHRWENLPSPPLIPDVKIQPSTLGLGESDLFVPEEPDRSKLPATSQVAAQRPFRDDENITPSALHNNDQVKRAAQEMLDQAQGLRRPPILGQLDKTNALFEAKDNGQLEEHLTEETVCRGAGHCAAAAMGLFSKAPGAVGKMAAALAQPVAKGAEKLCHNAFAAFREDGKENSTNIADSSNSHSTSHNQRVINP